MNKEIPLYASDDDAWEPGGTLGNDERYARIATDEEAARIDKALGFRIRLRRWLRKKLQKK